MSEDIFICSLEDYFKKHKRKCNKCASCGKVYKLPNYIFEPRDKVCFTCEVDGEILGGLTLLHLPRRAGKNTAIKKIIKKFKIKPQILGKL